MNRGKFPAQAGIPAFVTVHAAFLGGGAATNCTLPADGVLTDTTSTYPKQANFGSTCTYNAATGKYIVTLSETLKNILFVGAQVVKAGASPTANLRADAVVITPGTTINVQVCTQAGTLTDLGTNDMLILKIDAADTSAINGIT